MKIIDETVYYSLIIAIFVVTYYNQFIAANLME